MNETTLQEHTQERDLAQGFRSLVLTEEAGGSRQILAINIHHADDISLDGEQPAYMTLPGTVADNVKLAAMLTRAAAACLARPHECTVGFEITRSPSSPRAFCHEG